MPEPEVTPKPTDADTKEPTPTPGAVAPQEPHPLEPGGQRFDVVYKDMQEARREVARLTGELDAVKQMVAAKPAAPAAAEKLYTPQELQALVDAQRISPAVMADQLAYQRAILAKREIRSELQAEARVTNALTEVQSYMDAIPDLYNDKTDKYQKVKRAAVDIAADLGRTINDPVVQRRALREVFGSLDRVKTARGAADHARERGDTFAEVGGGGGDAGRTRDGGASDDPLKGVHRAYIEHWQRLGYTKEQMANEAKYITRREPRPRERV